MPTARLAVLLLFLAASCGSYKVYVRGESPLYPDEAAPKVDRPVKITIYQLRARGKFDSASMEDLWDNPADTLKDELVEYERPEQRIDAVNPKEVTIEIPEMKQDTNHVGLVALYKYTATRPSGAIAEVASYKAAITRAELGDKQFLLKGLSVTVVDR